MIKEGTIKTVLDVAQAPKSALTVSGVTTAAGMSEYFNLLPLGQITLAVGIVSTIIMGIIQLSKFVMFLRIEKDNYKLRKLEREKAHLEVEALKYEASTREP